MYDISSHGEEECTTEEPIKENYDCYKVHVILDNDKNKKAVLYESGAQFKDYPQVFALTLQHN